MPAIPSSRHRGPLGRGVPSALAAGALMWCSQAGAATVEPELAARLARDRAASLPGDPAPGAAARPGAVRAEAAGRGPARGGRLLEALKASTRRRSGAVVQGAADAPRRRGAAARHRQRDRRAPRRRRHPRTRQACRHRDDPLRRRLLAPSRRLMGDPAAPNGRRRGSGCRSRAATRLRRRRRPRRWPASTPRCRPLTTL